MGKEEEIELVTKLLAHPAGYDVDIAGLLTVRRYEHPVWVVEAEDGGATEFDNPRQAASFFVQRRHELRLGLDHDEAALLKEAPDLGFRC